MEVRLLWVGIAQFRPHCQTVDNARLQTESNMRCWTRPSKEVRLDEKEYSEQYTRRFLVHLDSHVLPRHKRWECDMRFPIP
jgi:hypothetical protein